MCFLTPVSSPTSSSPTCRLPSLPVKPTAFSRAVPHHLPKPTPNSSPTPTTPILSLQLVTWHCYFLFTFGLPREQVCLF